MSKVISLCELMKSHGEYPFIITNEKELTFSESVDRIQVLIAHFRNLEIRDGTKFAVLCYPTLKVIVTLFALIEMEIEILLLNPKEPQNSVNSILKETGCDGLVFDENEKNNIPENISTYPIPSISNNGNIGTTESNQIDIEKPATIIRTSGSSGNPKYAVHSLKNHFASANSSNSIIPFSHNDMWILSLPLYHVSGLSILFRAIVCGGGVRIKERKESLISLIKDKLITHVSLVEIQLKQLLDDERTASQLTGFKCVLAGGGPVSVKTREACQSRGIPLRVTYGNTEMASQIATTSQNAGQIVSKDAGKVLPHCNVKIADDGEILVKGESLFLGYLEKERLVDPRDYEGYFATGDIGKIEDENFYVFGRKDLMIISGGENINPEELENAALELETVKLARVVPVSDNIYGQRPVMFVDMDGEEVEKRIISYLKNKLPRYQLPIRILKIPSELKMNETGKINRLKLIKIAEEKVNSKLLL